MRFQIVVTWRRKEIFTSNLDQNEAWTRRVCVDSILWAQSWHMRAPLVLSADTFFASESSTLHQTIHAKQTKTERTVWGGILKFCHVTIWGRNFAETVSAVRVCAWQGEGSFGKYAALPWRSISGKSLRKSILSCMHIFVVKSVYIFH